MNKPGIYRLRRIQRIRVGPYRLRVRSAGTGPRTLVLLASPVVHSGVYGPTLRALARLARVFIVDLPGSGFSSRLKNPLSMVALADLVPLILDALGLSTAILIGHSNSGPVALLAAARYGERLEQLVLVDSVGAHPVPGLRPVILGRALDALLEPRLSLTGWHSILFNLLLHPRNLLYQISCSPGERYLTTASVVTVPVLVAWGHRDHTVPLEAGKRFAATLPNARLLAAATGSHDWLIEDADDFAEALRPFLAEQGASG